MIDESFSDFFSVRRSPRLHGVLDTPTNHFKTPLSPFSPRFFKGCFSPSKVAANMIFGTSSSGASGAFQSETNSPDESAESPEMQAATATTFPPAQGSSGILSSYANMLMPMTPTKATHRTTSLLSASSPRTPVQFRTALERVMAAGAHVAAALQG